MPFSHDPFFRRTFGRPDHVVAFLRGLLAPAEVATLDLEQLKRIPDSYVTPALRRSYADVVWQCPLIEPDSEVTGPRTAKPPVTPETADAATATKPSEAESQETATLCILIEHKAQPTAFPYPQLLGYIASIWERQFAQEGRIHPVLPILFHQGQAVHLHIALQERFLLLPDWLRPLTPLFDYRPCDLRTLGLDELPAKFAHPELPLNLAAMKWGSEKLPPKALVDALARVPRGWSLKELQAFKTYIGGSGDLTPYDLDRMADLRPDPERREFMTLKEHLFKLGHEQGIEQGIAEGLRQARLEDARKMKAKGCETGFISEITGLTPEEIASL
jgi:hypothetical protein